MTALLGAVALASLAGSLHCVGMCGGLVAFCVGGDPSRGIRRGLVHAAYSGGRLVAYLGLGAAAGSVGAALDIAGRLAGAQRMAGVVAGVVMVAWGVAALAELRGLSLFRHSRGGATGRWLAREVAAFSQRPPLVRSLAVGLLTGLLPCGWLWAFVVTAAGTASAPAGAAVMASFWIGTVPALVATGFGVQLITAPLRRHVPTVTALLLVAVGLVALVGRPSSMAAAASASRTDVSGHPQVPGSDVEPPCCRPAS